jgi:hypothetical protein
MERQAQQVKQVLLALERLDLQVLLVRQDLQEKQVLLALEQQERLAPQVNKE